MKFEQLINREYLNIQDAEELQQIINLYQISLDTIAKQMQELTEIRNKAVNEHETIVNKMRAMQDQTQKKTKMYRLQLEEAADVHAQTIGKMNEEHERILKMSQIRHSNTLEDKSDLDSKGLEFKQNKYSSYEEEQLRFLTEIKRKSAELIEKQYQHHDNMNKQEYFEIQENRKLLLKHLDLIKELKKNVKAYAGKVVFKEKETNQSLNYDLKVKLLSLQEEVTRLRRDRNNIMKANNENKINISLNQEELEEYKAVGSVQKSKIKGFNDKIESMKKTITAELSKLESKIGDKKKYWEGEMRASKIKLFNLEKNKEALKINLEKYKILGETILMQREEVEEFFLMAIQSCKQEMGETGGMHENIEKHYGEKVDIDELLPKDKHRIITNLYTKLALAPSK